MSATGMSALCQSGANGDGSQNLLTLRSIETQAVTSTVSYVPPPGAAPLCGISPDGSYFLKTDENHTWIIFDTITGAQRFTVSPGPYTGIMTNYIVTFSPDGAYFVTHWEDGRMQIWNAKHEIRAATIRRPSGRICGLEFSHDGETVAVGHEDGTVKFHSFRHVLLSGVL